MLRAPPSLAFDNLIDDDDIFSALHLTMGRIHETWDLCDVTAATAMLELLWKRTIHTVRCYDFPVCLKSIWNKISFKKEGLPSCSESFNCFVRHFGTFVNASHNWYVYSKSSTKKLMTHHTVVLSCVQYAFVFANDRESSVI